MSDNPIIQISDICFAAAEDMVGNHLDKHPAKPLAISSVKLLKVVLDKHVEPDKGASTPKALGQMVSITQASLEAFQATTAIIGVGTVAGAVLSAVNLYQTLKLRDDIKQLKLAVNDGFVDLKKAMQDQGTLVLQRIEEVAADITFKQHRLELIKAYGRFSEAVRLMKEAVLIRDLESRNDQLANVRQTLGESLGIYNNPHLLAESSSIGQLRRLECSWAIEQTIALTYQLQNELSAASDRLAGLQSKIYKDCQDVTKLCASEEERDILFPEMVRIHDQDLSALTFWQESLTQLQEQPSFKALSSSAVTESDLDSDPLETELGTTLEQIYYENVKRKSHTYSLNDQFHMIMNDNLRQEQLSYINQRSVTEGHKALVAKNLDYASNMAIANIYWYLKTKEQAPTAIANKVA